MTMRDIAFVHKKQKLDKEGRLQVIKVTVDTCLIYNSHTFSHTLQTGRSDEDKYKYKKKRLNPHSSTTNKVG